MPRTALLYDVHGNLRALEAVLEDAECAGASAYVLGGDYALFGPEPDATVARLRTVSNAHWIRGNGERWTARPDEAPHNEVVQGAIAACREALGPALVTELEALPEQLVLETTRFCHGSPISDVRSFMPEPTDDEAELLNGAAEPRLVFGHTHLPFVRRALEGANFNRSVGAPASGPELINPGSVGMPFDGDTRAAYALLEDDGTIEHRRVAYDHAAAAQAVAERFGGADWTETVARRISTAQF
jgi:diadenosine tetraphosphatase ApaH/serine/threonine PP2A family protein phosphatase